MLPKHETSCRLILVGCAQTAAVLDESMSGGMGDRWDLIIGWLVDQLVG